MIVLSELGLSAEDHDKAFIEVSFLLDVLINTAKEMVGNPGPLGTTAGRQMAQKLPVRLVNPSFGEAMGVIQEKLISGFDLTCRSDAGGVDIAVGRCAMRDVCGKRRIPLGGELCTAFHYYLAGMAAELLRKRARATGTTAGERCTFRLEIK